MQLRAEFLEWDGSRARFLVELSFLYRVAVGIEGIENLQKFQPPEFFRTRMQRFFAYYCDNFSFAHYIKTKMLNSQTREEAEKNFRAYFEEVPEDKALFV